MVRSSRLPSALLALTLAGPAAAQEAPAELFIVARPTPLTRFTADGGATEVAGLQPGDLLRTAPTTATAAPHLRHVFLIDRRREPLAGWADVRRCYAFPGASGPLPKPARAADADDYPPVLPALIRRQPAHVQQAFQDVEAAVARNLKLDPPLPEPYFVRARIWAMVKNYDAALRDYVTASGLVRDGKRDPMRYVTYFDGMTDLLDGLDRVPKAPDPGAADYHYNQGRSAFWSGRDARAMRYFDDAIALDPAEPLYWYYRGMLFRRRGDERRAAHDARVGAAMERINRKQGRSPDYLLTALERVQGPTREWLNKIRKGDHAAR